MSIETIFGNDPMQLVLQKANSAAASVTQTLQCNKIDTFYKSPTVNGETITIGANNGIMTNVWTVVTPSAVNAHEFSPTLSDEINYDGAAPLCCEITARVNISMPTPGVSKTCMIQIFKNGSTIHPNAESAVAIEFNAFSSGALLLNINTHLVQNDKIKMMIIDIESGTPTKNVKIYSAQLSISGYVLV